ncbi:death domain-containing immune deficiency protein [Cochliomyia hominivorax]
MFFIRKIFNLNSKSTKAISNFDCLERDALPIDVPNSNSVHQRNTSHNFRSNDSHYFVSEINDISSNVENTTNVNNVNQQVVVQFSNINGLQIGSTYNINKSSNYGNKKGNENSDNKFKVKYPKTVTIDAMMKSQDEPNREMLNAIATHLGSDYKHFMRELGFSDGQISAKIIDHNMYGVKEVIYQLLLEWIRNADDEGTVGYLITKLWNSGQRECVYRLKILWKSKDFIKNKVTD